MCGIVGYIGEAQAAPILLDGLSRLGYREIRQFCFPAFVNRDAEEAEWYCVLARK